MRQFTSDQKPRKTLFKVPYYVQINLYPVTTDNHLALIGTPLGIRRLAGAEQTENQSGTA
jgi:hypothetical protein